MARKTTYTWVAVGGIAIASAAAWWFQQQPADARKGAGGAPAAAGPAAGGGGLPGVEVARVQTVSLRDDAQSVGTLRSRSGFTNQKTLKC